MISGNFTFDVARMVSQLFMLILVIGIPLSFIKKINSIDERLKKISSMLDD